MNAGSVGGRAALPAAGYRPRSQRDDRAPCRVRFVPENPAEQPREFEFADLPLSPVLRQAFAVAFAERTRPGGPIRTVTSALKTWWNLRMFADYLAGLRTPPLSPDELTPAQLKGWFLPRHDRSGAVLQLGELKLTLRKVQGISAEFLTVLGERNPPLVRPSMKRSYSRSENQRILNAARGDVRRATERIRGNRELLARWRAGELGTEPKKVRRTGELLDYVDRHTDVPRYRSKAKPPMFWVSELGTVQQHVTALHLTNREAVAFAVLLVGLTGQNLGTILSAPAVHHRPDGYAGGITSAIVELDKPRRGTRRHMDVPLTSLPRWAALGEPHAVNAERADRAARVDLRSPFGSTRCSSSSPRRPARCWVATDCSSGGQRAAALGSVKGCAPACTPISCGPGLLATIYRPTRPPRQLARQNLAASSSRSRSAGCG